MRFLVALAMLFIATSAAPQASPPQERPQDRWNLADLYASADTWNADLAKVEADLPGIGACKGHLGESARKLRECFDLESEVFKRFLRLAVYANELHAEDTGNQASLQLQQKYRVVGAKLSEATSFVNPEILAIGEARIGEFLREEPGLAIYRHQLDDILRAAPHTLARRK